MSALASELPATGRWDGDAEEQAEEEWDDAHPLRMWFPGGESLAPWLGTPGCWIVPILEHANISKEDVLCDVGCGDGRIPIIAHQHFQANAVGIDLDRELIDMAVAHANRRLGTTNIEAVAADEPERYEVACNGGLSFICSDALTEDLSSVTLMVVYLLPESFEILAPLFQQHLSRPRSSSEPTQRLVIIGWKPPNMIEIKDVEFGQDETATSSHVYYYDVTSLPGVHT